MVCSSQALRAAEYEASYNSARAALRLEKLLEKGVPLSDELVIACQRGEPWAIAELDRLIREHLTPDEINELLAQVRCRLVAAHLSLTPPLPLPLSDVPVHSL